MSGAFRQFRQVARGFELARNSVLVGKLEDAPVNADRSVCCALMNQRGA